MDAHSSQQNEKTVARQTHALSTLVRLLARQAAAEQFAAAQQPSSPHDPMKDKERHDG